MRALTRTQSRRRIAHLSAVALASVLFAPLLIAEAQQARKTYRIGILSELTQTATVGPRAVLTEDAWRAPFRQRGYVEGQNAVFEFRHAGEHFERLPTLVEELVRFKVDIIMTNSKPRRRSRRSASRRPSRSSQCRLTLSVRDWSPAWPGRAVMLPDYFSRSLTWARSACSSSARPCRISTA